jgi:DNA-binding CsgD family transcriptional regulator
VKHPDLLAFSGFLADAAALAAKAAPTTFRQDVLELLRPHIAFDAAIWGTAAIGSELSFHEVVLIGLTEDALTEIEAGASADPRLLQVLGSPGTTMAYSVDPDDPPTLRLSMARHGIKHIMSTADFDAELGLANGIVLLRAETSVAFDDLARQLMEATFPHLTRGWSETQINALRAEIAASIGLPRYAAASHHGILVAAEDYFLQLFRLEWAGWKGPLLPETVRGLLLGPGGGRHVGERIVLSIRHGQDVSLLQIRERVAVDDLRPREREVAELCAGGASYREIAVALNIAPSTARNHLAAVHKRLGVSRNTEVSALLAAAR